MNLPISLSRNMGFNAIGKSSRLVFLLLLAGCGFHLRGTEPLPEQFSVLYIQGGNSYGEFRQALDRTLPLHGVKVVDDPKKAKAVLLLQQVAFDRWVLSVGPKGKAREYGLALRIRFALKDAKGQTIVPSQGIVIQRDYSFELSQALGKGDEESLLRRDMIRDAVQQLIWRLQSL